MGGWGEGGGYYEEGFNWAVGSAQPDSRGFAAGQHIWLKLAGRGNHQLSSELTFPCVLHNEPPGCHWTFKQNWETVEWEQAKLFRGFS